MPVEVIVGRVFFLESREKANGNINPKEMIMYCYGSISEWLTKY
jgi:hypothetical protein